MKPWSLACQSFPGPQRAAKSCVSWLQFLMNFFPYTLPYRSPTAYRMLPLKKSGMPIAVMYERVWSQFMRLVQMRLRRAMMGTLIDASHVRPSIVPAFFHCDPNPEETDGGTCKIWSVTMS